jgi:hypothetical protein
MLGNLCGDVHAGTIIERVGKNGTRPLETVGGKAQRINSDPSEPMRAVLEESGFISAHSLITKSQVLL